MMRDQASQVTVRIARNGLVFENADGAEWVHNVDSDTPFRFTLYDDIGIAYEVSVTRNRNK